MTRRPTGRLIAAVLIAILSITSVHGTSSAAAPISAIATAHASIGAALFHPTPSAGNDEDGAGPGRTAAQCRTGEELRPPLDKWSATDISIIAVARLDGPPISSVNTVSKPVVGPDTAVLCRVVASGFSRAPPA